MDPRLLANLKTLFNPHTVAVVDASENPEKLGYHVMKSLTQGGFQGKIVPINPNSNKIMGIDSFPSINEFDGKIDVAIIVLPAKLVPQIFDECVKKDIKGQGYSSYYSGFQGDRRSKWC
jgi:acyl-CoA synthetase (NDP forming)